MSRFLPAAIVLVVAGCDRPAPRERDPSQPDLRLERVEIRAWAADRLRVVTHAERVDMSRERGTPGDITATDARVTLVADGTRLTAPVVTGNLVTAQFVAQGGVTMEAPKGLRASTPVVAFDRALGAGGLAWSDAGVVLVQPGLRVEADGFTYDVADEHATFERARTEFQPRTP